MNLFRDRGLLKQVVFCLAVITYIVSFLFFALGILALRRGAGTDAAVDFVMSFYFLFQVLFLFALTFIIDRRRAQRPIAFPDRRKARARTMPVQEHGPKP